MLKLRHPISFTQFSICVIVIAMFATPSATAQQPKKTLRVFVLAGQSNMQGHAVVDMDHPEHYNGGKGNLVNLLKKEPAKYSHLRQGTKWSVRDDVLVRFKTEHETKTGGLSIGFAGYQDRKHFGPELQFGHVVGDHFDEPVLLIKTAWGGKSLTKDFRSPSSVRDRGGEVGEYYTKMMDEVKEGIAAIPTEFPELKDHEVQLSGFVWQQGWNDMVDEAAAKEYTYNLICLIIDLRRAWNSPDLPVVVGELGNGGTKDINKSMKFFRGQQSRIAAHPAFVGNVLFAATAQHARPAEESPNTGHGHHWFGNAASYLGVGEELGKQMIQLHTQPKSPRVLILGDSISIGYTPFVKRAFAKKAFVVRPMSNHRAAENCAGTDKGIQSINRWLKIGGGQWDVIHFNFGLHDLKHVNAKTGRNSNDPSDPEQSPPADYERQLRQIVDKLKATGAELVFATTTPVPEGGVKPFRDPKAANQYNEIAKKVMAENGIAINDLYTLANDQLSEIQRPVDVHFTKEGSQALGKQVVQAIEEAITRSAQSGK